MADVDGHPALWCHGAAGIGLSRLLIQRHHRDEQLTQEARAAVALVSTHGFGHNHSLCHGDFGALALLDLAERTGAGQAGHDALAGSVVRDIQDSGVRCGLTGGLEMPGLMLGSAGVCLSLLRLAWPQDVPVVSWLESPRDRDAR